MQQYSWNEYQKDVHEMARLISEQHNKPHIVTLYRGGLPLGTHLSNLLVAPLSILKYQSYDGSDKEITSIHSADFFAGQTIVIVDDLGDSYESLVKAYEFLQERYPEAEIVSYTLFGKPEKNNMVPNNTYIQDHKGMWIQFPWES